MGKSSLALVRTASVCDKGDEEDGVENCQQAIDDWLIPSQPDVHAYTCTGIRDVWAEETIWASTPNSAGDPRRARVIEMRGIRDRRAVSPVIATVILVAVAITIAVVVAYWTGGISNQYTRFEKVEVTSGYYESNYEEWNVTLTIRNTGTSQATITGVLVNGKGIDEYGSGNIVTYDENGAAIDWDLGTNITPGSSTKLKIVVAKSPKPSTAYSFSSGTTVEVSLLSAAGNTYMKAATLI